MAADLLGEDFALLVFAEKPVTSLEEELTSSGTLRDEVRVTHPQALTLFWAETGEISLPTWLHAYNLHISKLMIAVLKFYYPCYLVQ